MNALLRARIAGVLFLLLPLAGCLGGGDMFREKRFIAGDYFLTEGEGQTTDDLYLSARDQSGDVAGPLFRIGWNQQYIVFAEPSRPEQWDVIDVRDRHGFRITDLQRTQDPRFQQITIGSAEEAWQRAAKR